MTIIEDLTLAFASGVKRAEEYKGNLIILFNNDYMWVIRDYDFETKEAFLGKYQKAVNGAQAAFNIAQEELIRTQNEYTLLNNEING